MDGRSKMQRLFVGLDVGTQGARALACDESGRVAARASSPFPEVAARSPQPGWSEQDPRAWWSAAYACLKHLMAGLAEAGHSPDQVAALSVDSTSGTVLLMDSSGESLGWALMYNDNRAVVESDEANAAAGEFLQRMGYRFQASFALPKILWLMKNRPRQVEHAAWFAHPTDYLLVRLGAEAGVTDSSNVLKTGYDLVQGCWPDFIARRLNVPSAKLPRVVRCGSVVGRISAMAAQGIGLPQGTLLVAGATDGTAGFLASGACEVGDWNSTLGTTLVMRGVSENLISDPSGRIYCHSHPDGYWLPGAASNVGGECLVRLFRPEALAELDRAAAELFPKDILVYPLVRRGERFPFVHPSAEGFMLGEPRSEAERYAAHLEGVALVERWGLDVMHEAGAPVSGRLYASGGGARSDLWLQVRANALGRALHVPEETESAMGAVILAAAASFGSVRGAARALVRIERCVEPRSWHGAYFEEKYHRLREACRQRGYL